VIEAFVTAVLIGVFLLFAGVAALTVRRLFRETVEPGRNR
jgi:nitrate reductase gamma subunit